MRAALVVFAAVMLIPACSGLPGTAKASPSAGPSGSPLAKASGKLDAQAPMPAGFPGDCPIYPGARLTAGAGFVSSGEVSWGMEWETLDTVAKVQAFYAKQLNQGDWTVTLGNTTATSFAATFSRKSNSHEVGTLVADSGSGVTKILMSLISPS